MKGIGIVLGIPLMAKILKWSDFTIAIIGAVISIGFYLFLALASTTWMMFVGEYILFWSLNIAMHACSSPINF